MKTLLNGERTIKSFDTFLQCISTENKHRGVLESRIVVTEERSVGEQGSSREEEVTRGLSFQVIFIDKALSASYLCAFYSYVLSHCP
jgi:hypothetical protein